MENSALSEGFDASDMDTTAADTTADMSQEVIKSDAKSKHSLNSTSTLNDPLDLDRNGSTENLIVTTANESRSIGEDEILNIPEPATSEHPIRDTSKTDCPSTWSTTPAVYWLLLTNLFMVLMVFILPVICGIDEDNEGQSGKQHNQCGIDPFSILIYSHSFYWGCHLMGDQYLKYHHRRARLLGYLEFYIKTKNLRRSPFYLISGGNAILLITATILNDTCYQVPNCPKWVNIELLRAIICLECMTVSFMWTKYTVAVKKFKKDNKMPDVYREEFRRRVLNKGVDISGTSDQLLNDPESRDEIDVMELQSELLVCLCPKITEEPDLLRQILHREATGNNLPREDA